jgi:hypothetical protein
VGVTGVGHTPLSWRIDEGCGTSGWDAILADGDLEAALAACNVDATVEYAAAGEWIAHSFCRRQPPPSAW